MEIEPQQSSHLATDSVLLFFVKLKKLQVPDQDMTAN